MLWLFIVLAPLLLGFAAFALAGVSSRRAIHRAETRPLTERGQIGVNHPRFGFRRTLRAAHFAHHAEILPLEEAITERQEAEQRTLSRFEKHGAPILAAHSSLVAHTIFMSILSSIGVFMFVANIRLDIGLIRTLEIADDQAKMVGCIVAVLSTLIGLLLMEVIRPGEAIPAIKEMKREHRIGLFVGMASLFVAALVALPFLATARAQTRLGERAAQAEAACKQATADPSIASAERVLACSNAERAETQLQRAARWDQLVSIGAPLGEAVGSWAFLRLAELIVAGCLAVAARRARRRRRRAEGQLDQVNRRWTAGVERESLGVPEAELVAPPPPPSGRQPQDTAGQTTPPPDAPPVPGTEAPEPEQGSVVFTAAGEPPSPDEAPGPRGTRWDVF